MDTLEAEYLDELAAEAEETGGRQRGIEYTREELAEALAELDRAYRELFAR